MNAAFFTLGCKVNQYDTDAMIGLFRAAGHTIVSGAREADVCVVNSCAVTATSEKKARQLISRLHRENPQALIAVCGCYAQHAADDLLSLEGVRVVAGSKDRAGLLGMIEQALAGKAPVAIDPGEPPRGYEELSAFPESRTRAHLKIQDGCDRFCTYCIIPYVRGRSCSRDLADIRRAAQRLVESGVKEIVLCGINLSSYGKDNGHALTDAIDAALASGITRLRLGSLNPELITPEFAAFAAERPAICPHFHLSMQSGSATVLLRMRRRHTPASFLRAVALLREAMPGCAITADIIAGFPEETQAEHEETMALVREAAFAKVHVFPYSRREGTAAAKLRDLSRAVKEGRARELIALGHELTQAYLASQLGTTQDVLFETSADGRSCGHTATYIEVCVGETALPGTLAPVQLLCIEDECVLGKPK